MRILEDPSELWQQGPRFIDAEMFLELIQLDSSSCSRESHSRMQSLV
jgi:hypothetical protein